MTVDYRDEFERMQREAFRLQQLRSYGGVKGPEWAAWKAGRLCADAVFGDNARVEMERIIAAGGGVALIQAEVRALDGSRATLAVVTTGTWSPVDLHERPSPRDQLSTRRPPRVRAGTVTSVATRKVRRVTTRRVTTRKVTVSLDATALVLAERAAAREGLSMSAWLSRAARREAVRTGVGPGVVDGLADAVMDEAELAEAERDMRAAG